MQIKTRNNFINILLIIGFLLFIVFVYKVPFINSFSHEEKLLSLIAVQNFERYGLFETYLLPNYTFTKGDMPYVYTHLNDLPSILNYLLLKLWNDHTILRVFYTAITLTACLIMYLVFRDVISYHIILSTVFVFITEKYYINSIDHLHIPLTLLTYSIQLYILFKIHLRQNICTALNIVFASTFSWFACMTLVIGACIYACKNIREINIKLIIYTLIAFMSSIMLKIFNNSLYLGFELALSEILNTVTNRIYNYPTFLEMYKTQQENGIVQWGSQTVLKEEGVLNYYIVVLIKLIYNYVVPILIIFALSYIAPNIFAEIIKRNKGNLIKIFLLILSLGAWEIFFPSHAKGYTNTLLLNFMLVLRYVLIAFILLEIILIANIKLINIKKFAYIYSIYMLMYGIFNITYLLYHKKYIHFEPPNELTEIIKGKIVYTNISAVFIGYFQNEIHLAGRCLPESVGKHIIGNCNNIFENVYDVSTFEKFSNPDYFIFNNQLISGNMSYVKEKDLIWYEKYLDENLERIKTYDNSSNQYKYILYKFK